MPILALLTTKFTPTNMHRQNPYSLLQAHPDQQ